MTSSNNSLNQTGEPSRKRLCVGQKASSRPQKTRGKVTQTTCFPEIKLSNSHQTLGTTVTTTRTMPISSLLNQHVSKFPRAPQPSTIGTSFSTNTSSVTQQEEITLPNLSERNHPRIQIPQETLNPVINTSMDIHEDHDSLTSDQETSSDDDCNDGGQDLNDLGGNFACHVANLPAHQGIDIDKLNFQYAEPISTPISSQVSSKLKKKIWRNTYFDIASLLPRAPAAQQGQFSLQLGSRSQFKLVPSVQTRKIYTIEAWTAAFIRFAAIYTERYPTEAPQIFKYMEIVRDLAFKKPGNAWQIYDQQFRSLRENVPVPWGRLHTEFWVMSSGSSQSRSRPRQFSQKHNFRGSSTDNKPFRFLENTCWTYNRRGYCRKFECTFQHRCGFCRGNHNATACTTSLSRTSNTQTTNSKVTQFSGGKACISTTQSTGTK